MSIDLIIPLKALLLCSGVVRRVSPNIEEEEEEENEEDSIVWPSDQLHGF